MIKYYSVLCVLLDDCVKFFKTCYPNLNVLSLERMN